MATVDDVMVQTIRELQQRAERTPVERAAPKMLEALRKHRHLWDRVPTGDEIRAARADFGAAIAAATGGEQ